MNAVLNSPEERFPVSLCERGRLYQDLTFAQAEKLRGELSDAVAAIWQHFQCSDEAGTKSCPGWRCPAKGSIKIAGKYYCKRHAKKAAK